MSSDTIISTVSEHYDIPVAEIKNGNRHAEVVLARDVCIYIMRQQTGMTLAEVGKLFSNRSPATVSHGYQQVASMLNQSEKFRDEVVEVIRQTQYIYYC